MKKALLILRIIFGAMLLFVMVFIFMNSHANSNISAASSGKVTDLVAPAVIKDYKELPPEEQTSKKLTLEPVIRQYAHAIEFCALGFLSLAFMITFMKKPIKLNWQVFPIASLSFLFSVLYASTDELHQHFVEGRAAEVKDLLADSVGAAIGIVICFCLWCLICKVISLKARRRKAN